MKKSVGFIGAGRITRIFLQAWQNKGFYPSETAVFDISGETLLALKQNYPGVEITTVEKAAGQDIVVIALHPPVIMDTLEHVKNFIKPQACVISLAPKITMGKISGKLNGPQGVARMIPNAASYINKGYNPVCFSDGFKNQDEIMQMMELLGDTFMVDETKLEVYAIVSAMFPTYFWFQWQEMQQIGEKLGLSKAEARETVEKTLFAAVETMYNSGLSYEEVVDLIPVRPIAAHEPQIRDILSDTLCTLFDRIKP
jgi:pyrroline-5-carboxylate reductase